MEVSVTQASPTVLPPKIPRSYDHECRCEEVSEACHTAYERDCQVTYRPQTTKVKVRVCPHLKEEVVEGEGGDGGDGNSVVIDVRPTPRAMKETR